MAQPPTRIIGLIAASVLALTISAPFAPTASATPTSYSADLSFATKVGSSIVSIYDMAVQKDDKILIYGLFSDSGSNAKLRRFTKDGDPDTAFNNNAALEIASSAQSTKIAVAPGGKIVVGGGVANVSSYPLFLKRLNTDGTLDSSFSYTPTNTLQALGVQPDGEVLISGSFGSSPSVGVLRLNEDGTLDTAFNSAANATQTPATGMPSAFAFDGDATNFSVIMGGATGLFKLDASGNRSWGISATNSLSVTNASVSKLDGSILIGGLTSSSQTTMKRYDANGTLQFAATPRMPMPSSSRVLALPDGTSVFADGAVRLFDTSGTELSPSPMTTSGNDLNFVARQTDGSLLIGGGFTPLYNSHGKSLARFTNPSAADPDTTQPVISGGNTNPAVTAGNTAVATYTADESVTWSLGGADAALFQITGGVLSFTNPAVAGSYTVDVVATDAANNVTTTTVTVTVSGSNSNNGGGSSNTGGSTTTDTTTSFGVNPSFANNLGSSFGSSSVVDAIATDPRNGDIVTGGDFGSSHLKRFNAKGVPNSVFNKNVVNSLNKTVNAVVVESDGDSVVGGKFSGYLKRFSSKGVRDTKFKPSLDGAVNALALESDGDIIAAGDFTGHLKRFHTDGTADTSFNNAVAVPSDANAVAIDASGNIVVGGDFGVLRFDANGAADANFNTAVNGAITGSVTSVEILSDGSVIVGGEFGVKKFSSSGVADATYDANAASLTGVLALSAQTDDSVLVGGSFAGRLTTLTTTGAVSATGASVTGGAVRALATQAGGSVIVGGSITGKLAQLAAGTKKVAKTNAYFKAGSTKLTKKAKTKIKKIYTTAKKGTIVTVKVTGYAKPNKNGKYKTVAAKRAKTVATYLKKLGFKTKVTTAKAKGGKTYKGRKAAVKITYITAS